MSGKRQHVIPQFHLKYFIGHDPKNHLWIYDSYADKPRSATTKNVAVETHFYSIEMNDGTMNPLIDDYITDVESKAAPIYRDIIGGQIPGDDQKRADFSTFLSVMYYRTTAMRKVAAELYASQIQIQNYAIAADDRALDANIRKYEEQVGRKIDDEEKSTIRKWMLNPGDHIKLGVPKEKTMIHMQNTNELMETLFQMKWSICEAKNGFFITSDNPVVRRVDPKTCHPMYGDHGFLNKSAQVTFPLSPKRLLVLTWEEPANEIFQIPSAYTDIENQLRATHSDRYLYAHINHKKLVKMVNEFKDIRPGITISGFGPEKYAEVNVLRKRKK